MNNSQKDISSRLDETEEWVSDLEDKVEKNSQSEHQKEKRIEKMRII